jgi:hypothetical protein
MRKASGSSVTGVGARRDECLHDFERCCCAAVVIVLGRRDVYSNWYVPERSWTAQQHVVYPCEGLDIILRARFVVSIERER